MKNLVLNPDYKELLWGTFLTLLVVGVSSFFGIVLASILWNWCRC